MYVGMYDVLLVFEIKKRFIIVIAFYLVPRELPIIFVLIGLSLKRVRFFMARSYGSFFIFAGRELCFLIFFGIFRRGAGGGVFKKKSL
jgi:hypothetical protein